MSLSRSCGLTGNVSLGALLQSCCHFGVSQKGCLMSDVQRLQMSEEKLQGSEVSVLQGFGLYIFSYPGLPEEGGVCKRRDLQPRSGHQECMWRMHGSCTIALTNTVVQRCISAKVCTGSSAAGATFTSSRKSAESNHTTTVARIGQLRVARQKPPPTSTLWQSSLTRACMVVLE